MPRRQARLKAKIVKAKRFAAKFQTEKKWRKQSESAAVNATFSYELSGSQNRVQVYPDSLRLIAALQKGNDSKGSIRLNLTPIKNVFRAVAIEHGQSIEFHEG